MSEAVWKSWSDFRRAISGKKVVFFGVAEDWFEKTFRESDPDVIYIADNSASRIGKKFLVNVRIGEVDVRNPEVLRQKSADIYVVITSGAYESIIPQLESYGMSAGKDFCCSPALNNLRVISDINGCKTKLLICSPDHKIYSELDKSGNVGGGLYLYDIGSLEYSKVMDGTIHNVVKGPGQYFVLDETRGALVVSKKFEVLGEFGFEMNAKSHGLAYDPARNFVFIGKTDLDKISVYDASTHALKFEINLSDKYSRMKQGQHHLNDIIVRGDYLYVSLFSVSGNFPRGVYDGGIVEIDIEDPGRRNVLVNSAWMPHSLYFSNEDLCYLDSMRGTFYKGTNRVVGKFEGNFVRGIGFDGRYYYIGTSESRYFDRLKGIANYIGMSAGFYLFDEETKAGKFFSMPKLRQVRNLAVYEESW